MKDDTSTSYQERILRALTHIQGQLDAELPLEDLARVACFSPYHFHRVFRGMVGEPVAEYVRRLRLERAAHRLKRQDQPVTELAFEAGYESHEAFTRAFRAFFGAAPSEYRAAHRPAPESPSRAHYDDLSAFRPPHYGNHAPVEIRTLRPERVIFIRHTGPYDRVSGTWQRLAACAGPRGLFGPGTRFVGVSWDDPDITPVERLRYDAAITVSRPVQPEGDIGVAELAGGPYASLVHKGPYETLGGAYQALFGGWLPSSGRELRDDPCLEFYLNSPQNTHPEDLLTAIHVPLA
jgi:AraC family transcriptional regulator